MLIIFVENINNTLKMNIYRLLFISLCLPFYAFVQTDSESTANEKKYRLSGIYIQWGYNVEWYTRSNIHFKMNNGDNFTLHKARGAQRTSFDAIYKHPLDITIPQYNWRVGFYINDEQTKAIEINFDHTKYVVEDGQALRVSGTLEGNEIDQVMIMDPDEFLHFEHTDGANFLHFNYVSHHTLLKAQKKDRKLVTGLWKAGAGVNIPRTDFTYKGNRLNNKFHISGFNISVEGGLRYYPTRTFFLEITGKTGYVNYLNALADTDITQGNRAHHHFGYVEFVGTIGGDIHFKSKKDKVKK